MDPLVFEPYLRPMVWGGRKLEQLCSKPLPPAVAVGESWEISPHAHHVSRVAEGPWEGKRLDELCREHAAELFGIGTSPSPQFPLLIKWLDCQQLLSIQVHPTDELAPVLARETYGKTEAWVIVQADAGAKVYAGFLSGVSREQVEQGLEDGKLEGLLHQFTPRPGDCLFLPAGTVHAVGGGVVMAEVQQASDATFRLYDWNRLGTDGKPRQLHIQEALEAIDWSRGPVDPVTPLRLASDGDGLLRERLVSSPYFEMTRVTIDSGVHSETGERAMVWLVLEGTGCLETGSGYQRPFRQGETVLVPSSTGPMTWRQTAAGGPLVLLRVSW
jgi:mannose-6-phosphate isomerase